LNYKLPFLKIIKGALLFAWINKSEFLKAISVPTLALVIIWGSWLYLPDDLNSRYKWIVLLIYGLGFSLFAVTCHRIILIEGDDSYKSFHAKLGNRELRFLVWVIIVYAIPMFLSIIAMSTALIMSGGVKLDDGGRIPYWIEQLASIPALYVFGRFSLVFPATAIDRNSGLNWSWKRTHGNGWRILIIVGLFPWLIGMAISFMWREEATVLEQVILSTLAYIGLSVEIIALSLTYKDLAKHYASGDQILSSEINSLRTANPLDSFHGEAQDKNPPKYSTSQKIIATIVICYLFITALLSHFIDCEDEVIQTAVSPGRLYKAELLNRSCKDSHDQGLILSIVNTTSPKTIHDYILSKTFAKEVDLNWTSANRLLISHTAFLDLSDAPIAIDDIEINYETKAKPAAKIDSIQPNLPSK
jgi:hypothetical protein